MGKLFFVSSVEKNPVNPEFSSHLLAAAAPLLAVGRFHIYGQNKSQTNQRRFAGRSDSVWTSGFSPGFWQQTFARAAKRFSLFTDRRRRGKYTAEDDGTLRSQTQQRETANAPSWKALWFPVGLFPINSLRENLLSTLLKRGHTHMKKKYPHARTHTLTLFRAKHCKFINHLP